MPDGVSGRAGGIISLTISGYCQALLAPVFPETLLTESLLPDPLDAPAAPVATKAASDAPKRARGAKVAEAEAPPAFEAALAELESLVGTMEDGSLPLETSLAAYRRGVALVRICQERLADVEGQVKVLEADLLRPLGADEA